MTWMTGDLKLTVLVEPTVKNEFIGKFPQLRTWYAARAPTANQRTGPRRSKRSCLGRFTLSFVSAATVRSLNLTRVHSVLTLAYRHNPVGTGLVQLHRCSADHFVRCG